MIKLGRKKEAKFNNFEFMDFFETKLFFSALTKKREKEVL